jgi:citrate lyase subunit beta/citryl-CoA lyase
VEKAAARRGAAALTSSRRINQPLPLAVRDIEHSICPDVDGIAITKADSASHVRLLDQLVAELEEKRGMPTGHTKFLVMIETPAAFGRIDGSVASPRVAAMNIGGEDFALNCNMQPTGEALFYPKQRMIIAANAAGVIPIGFIDSVAGFGDWEKFRKMVRRSRDFGFMGAGCIHPGQVTIVNEEYTPATEEVDYARKVIALDKQAASSGRGSFALDGKMIDIPIIVRAQKLIRRFEAIKQRESRTLAAVGV